MFALNKYCQLETHSPKLPKAPSHRVGCFVAVMSNLVFPKQHKATQKRLPKRNLKVFLLIFSQIKGFNVSFDLCNISMFLIQQFYIYVSFSTNV